MTGVGDDIYGRVRKIQLKRRGQNQGSVQRVGVKEGRGAAGGSGGRSDDRECQTTGGEKGVRGEGRIVTSGTTVQGFHTRFQQELKKGDYIEIEHPNTLIKERRRVATIVSERTLVLEREFSCDLISTSEYFYISVEDGRDHSLSADKGVTYSYREKEGMYKYKTVIKPMDSNLTREDILDIRAKKQRDKYCWI
ncbi:hypothetical protein OJ253_2906 [Cryptosporidium canis]|uniref:Uncharacterized protein n=1 Tax=Cryptosporidium canis TaxID=195482 RepID=A0A9D5DHF9_9CRYT|nr:hypothetical protein OJ253_2906 [Cryptosporidium canis]